MGESNDAKHRLLRVRYDGDKARYQCSCGEDGPWCRGAYGAPHDRRAFRSAGAEARELYECHLKIVQRPEQQAPRES